MRRFLGHPRGSWRATALLLITTCTAILVGIASAEEAPSFRLITHLENPATALDREFLADAFLKKRARWNDGEAIDPVDQRLDAAVRRAFSARVLGRSVAAVRNYWLQRIFTGRGVPPPELDSDDAVLRYVRHRRGAVGYVSVGADTTGVKPIVLRD